MNRIRSNSHRISFILALLGVMTLGCDRTSPPSGPATPQEASFEVEKAKALKYPFANDLGPASIDVSTYPEELQKTYRELLLVKCQRCHTASRPLNSQYVEPYGPKAEQAGKVERWRREHPEMFQDSLVWKIEPARNASPGVWQRYVLAMASKPGANIQPREAKRIWEFLTYDSEQRKTGAKAATWAAHRRQLLQQFKEQNPGRYRELYETE
jgi:hypothetical protein